MEANEGHPGWTINRLRGLARSRARFIYNKQICSLNASELTKFLKYLVV